MITLTVTPQAADLIIGALRQLPHAQVHELVMDLFAQAKSQYTPPEPAPIEEPETSTES
jgi:hypothetical protein